MSELNEQDIKKRLRRESFKKNWNLFKQSRLGMVGLYIVISTYAIYHWYME